MHTFWLSYPFQWNTSTDISTFVRNYFKSSIYNLYFLFRKFHSTFSVLFLLVSCTFEITIIRWQNSIRNSIILLAISTQTSMPWWNHPLLGIFGFVFLCARPTFQTDHWLSTLFTRCMKTKVPPKLMMAFCERAQMFWSAVEPQRVSVIRVSDEVLAILINCFSAPREDLSWFTLILSFGGSIVAGTVFGNSLSSRIPAINFPFHRFCHCYRNHCHTLNVWSYFGIINMHAHSEQWYSSYTKKRRVFFCRGGYMTPSRNE